jgi:HK97 family phage major capsid protein
MNLLDLRKEHKALLNKADAIVSAAEQGNRSLTVTEQQDFDTAVQAAEKLKGPIETIQARNTMHLLMTDGKLIPGGSESEAAEYSRQPKKLSADYLPAFRSYIASGGTKITAALYEGSDGAGGYAVPILVSNQIVPLAPPDMGVRKLATVIPTVSDIKIPRKGSFGVAGAKAESGATTNLFPETDPTIDQITLSAYMAGIQERVSWELAQDVPAFQQFAIEDMLTAQQIYEEAKYVGGSGTGEPQGLLGNVGTGVTAAVADASGNLLSIDATYDVMGFLKGLYRQRAAWLMQWGTGIAIRKAQRQANLFEPVFTSVGGKDYLHGFPVEYSTSMPAIAAGATPVLFGDFASGYAIGDRGGSGINVKILDQPLATAGQIVLLAYRRSDGRVRRSEAIQAITLHS